jgi:hypothetical protein
MLSVNNSVPFVVKNKTTKHTEKETQSAQRSFLGVLIYPACRQVCAFADALHKTE